MGIMIVTDSTSDISQAQAKELHVSVVPLRSIFGEKEYLEGIDLFPDEFYIKLSQAKDLPKTSQPSPLDFEQVFRQSLDTGDQVIAICLGSRFSGTYQSACIARERCGGAIWVIDSGTATLGLQVLVRRAIAMREAGKQAAEIADTIEEEKKSVRLFAVLDTLEYLFKGGRLSRTSAFAGSILNIKPLLSVLQGEIKVIGKAIGLKKAYDKLFGFAENAGGIDYKKPIAIGYTGDRTRFAQFEQMCQNRLEKFDPIISIVGSVIGTHAGPGAVAISFFPQNG